MIHFAALDVHRRTIRACIRNADGKIVGEYDLAAARESLLSFAQNYLGPNDQIALEATFNTWAIVRILAPLVGRVVVSNPMQTRAIAMAKVKTDKVDARVLSQLLRTDFLPAVWTPDEKTQSMRRLTVRRATLVAERTRLKNRIHSVLAALLIPLDVKDLFSAKGDEWLKGLPLPDAERAQIQSEQRLLDLVEKELELLDKDLAKLAWDDARVKLLMTLHGVDYPIAQTVLAALGDINRFEEAGDAAAYLGLVPSTHQSGPHCYHGPITKHGNGKARWMLVQAAHHAASHPGPLGVFFRKLQRKKNRNVAVVATARKLVVIAWHMLKNNEPYRYSQPKPTQDKLARLRIKATGKKRATGPRKGQPPSPNYGTGQRVRTIPSLESVYQSEGLPQAASYDGLKDAEKRILKGHGVDDFVQAIQKPCVRPRRRNTSEKEPVPKAVP